MIFQYVSGTGLHHIHVAVAVVVWGGGHSVGVDEGKRNRVQLLCTSQTYDFAQGGCVHDLSVPARCLDLNCQQGVGMHDVIMHLQACPKTEGKHPPAEGRSNFLGEAFNGQKV